MKYTIQQRDHITIRGITYLTWRNIETFEDHELARKELYLLQKNHQIEDQYQIGSNGNETHSHRLSASGRPGTN